jgi:hypothetical protein
MKSFIMFIRCLFCRKVKHYEFIGRTTDGRILLARADYEHFKNTQLNQEG